MSEEAEEFKRFLKRLDNDAKHDAVTVFAEAIRFVQGFGFNAKALSENPPMFYKITCNGIIFV